MTEVAKILLSLGSVLLLGVATDAIGRRTSLPRVSLLLLFGFLIGPGYLNLLPDAFVNSFDLTADMALVMIGFLLGGQFTLSAMREHGRQVFWISILAVVVTAAIVLVALVPLGVGLPLALLLAGIAPATAPAATFDVVREAKAQGPFTRTLLGVVFLCGGLAIWMGVSFLITSMVVGVVVVNLAQHHARPFHAIEDIEWPFMVIFFVLAGASLELAALQTIGLVACVYIAARAVGRTAGGWAGGMLCRAERPVCRWMGWALMPQAGVALGMALVASNRLPEFKEMLLPVVISSTVFFELTGPVLTRYALHRVGEA